MASSDPFLGIYSSRRLAALGLSARQVRRSVAEGRLTRIRPGWFHDATATIDATDAVRVGGILTATSGAPHHRMWTLVDDRFHVLVARNASRLHLERVQSRAVCLHWAKGAIARDVPVADPLQILIDSAHCQSRTTAVVLADSALSRGLVTSLEVQSALPALAPWCDPTSGSGTETIVRLGLRRLGIKVRTQVWFDSVGAVDLLVGDRLVIECDSAAYHDGYESVRDYERDQQLLRNGYLVLRLKYRHVVHEWSRVESLVLEIVRARRHRWRTGSAVRGSVLAL